MSTREDNFRDLVTQMLMINYEITVLAFRVEEAMPEVRRACYRNVRALQHGYKSLESMVESLIEAEDEYGFERYAEIDCALQELQGMLNRQGSAIRAQLLDQASLEEVLPGSPQEGAKTRSVQWKSSLHVKVRRRKRKPLKPLEDWVESELWSRKKIT